MSSIWATSSRAKRNYIWQVMLVTKRSLWKPDALLERKFAVIPFELEFDNSTLLLLHTIKNKNLTTCKNTNKEFPKDVLNSPSPYFAFSTICTSVSRVTDSGSELKISLIDSKEIAVITDAPNSTPRSKAMLNIFINYRRRERCI
jgi:hypothetical protein